MSKRLKGRFFLGKLEKNTKQFFSMQMCYTVIENIILKYSQITKSINWLKKSSERIWHYASCPGSPTCAVSTKYEFQSYELSKGCTT